MKTISSITLSLLTLLLVISSCSKESVELQKSLNVDQSQIKAILDGDVQLQRSADFNLWKGMTVEEQHYFLGSLEFSDGELRTGDFGYFMDNSTEAQLKDFAANLSIAFSGDAFAEIDSYPGWKFVDVNNCKKKRRYMCIQRDEIAVEN